MNPKQIKQLQQRVRKSVTDLGVALIPFSEKVLKASDELKKVSRKLAQTRPNPPQTMKIKVDATGFIVGMERVRIHMMRLSAMFHRKLHRKITEKG